MTIQTRWLRAVFFVCVRRSVALSMLLASATTSFADATGTGFVLSKAGYITTNYHVIQDATDIEVITSDGHVFSHVRVLRKDTTNDLVLLQVSEAGFASAFPSEPPFTFAPGSAKVGQECFTLGFPLGDVMGTTARLSTGVVDSIFGLQDNPTLVQISNPLQPGNSGGPLFNHAGEVIGVVVSGLNAKFFYERAGIIPQNVNFAIKAAYLKALVESLGEDFLSSRRNVLNGLPLDKQVEAIAPFVVRIAVKTVAQPRPTPQSEPPRQAPPVERQAGPPLLGQPFAPPLKGAAEVQFTKPVTKKVKELVVTTFQVKNMSKAPIARFTVDETWYDDKGNVVTGGKGVISILQPGEVQTMRIETGWNPKMKANNYNFSHANGTVPKPKMVDQL